MNQSDSFTCKQYSSQTRTNYIHNPRWFSLLSINFMLDMNDRS